VKRQKYDLSYHNLLTSDMGYLVPCGLTEVLPGDTIQHGTALVIRLSPLAAPVMHPVEIRIHHWFVPHSMVWDDWESFITGGEDGLDANTIPTISSTATAKTLLEYYGLPRVAGIDVNALPIRGFNKIYNSFYRDQDLITAVTEDSTTLQRISWAKDYFTTSRPWTQKGSEVSLPLGTEAPVTGLGKVNQTFASSSGTAYESGGSSSTSYTNYSGPIDNSSANTQFLVEEDPNNSGYPNVKADLSNATAASVRDLREAMALQRYAEARARFGGRYIEYLRYCGVSPSFERMELPEYLGGGRAQVQFSEILQTAPETGTAPSNQFGVGDMYGHGIGALRSNNYVRHFEEHGYIHTLMSVRPKAMYTNGIARHWLRTDKEDFFQKELAFIGQQEVQLNEVYADAASGTNTFGYQDRYNEYREAYSQVAGDFRDSLDHWHLGRILTSAPTLNQSFIECNPSKRVFNVTSEDGLWCTAQHRIGARRVVPRNSGGRII
jgi:hypothetical protein